MYVAKCAGNYEVFVESNAEGATPYQQITDLEDCAALCDNMLTCVAFDFDRNTPPYKGANCWIHTDANIVMKSQPSVDHHVKHPECLTGTH